MKKSPDQTPLGCFLSYFCEHQCYSWFLPSHPLEPEIFCKCKAVFYVHLKDLFYYFSKQKCRSVIKHYVDKLQTSAYEKYSKQPSIFFKMLTYRWLVGKKTLNCNQESNVRPKPCTSRRTKLKPRKSPDTKLNIYTVKTTDVTLLSLRLNIVHKVL